jgi:hypothetical protein
MPLLGHIAHTTDRITQFFTIACPHRACGPCATTRTERSCQRGNELVCCCLLTKLRGELDMGSYHCQIRSGCHQFPTDSSSQITCESSSKLRAGASRLWATSARSPWKQQSSTQQCLRKCSTPPGATIPTVGVTTQWVPHIHCCEHHTCLGIPGKRCTNAPYNPAIPLLDIYSK